MDVLFGGLRVFCLGLFFVGSSLSFGDENQASQASSPVEPARVTAQFGDDKLDSGARQLFLYSKTPLKDAQYRVGASSNWSSLVKAKDQDGLFVYFTSSYQQTDQGRYFLISAQTKANESDTSEVAFIDQVSVGEIAEGKPQLQVVGFDESKVQVPKIATVAPADKTVIQGDAGQNSDRINGGPDLDPGTVAQIRANYMASRHRGSAGNQPVPPLDHLGDGFPMTSMGRLAEGAGWGHGTMPSTCVARNGSQAIADRTATAFDGSIYRVRLYNSPSGTMQEATAKPVGKRQQGFKRKRR